MSTYAELFFEYSLKVLSMLNSDALKFCNFEHSVFFLQYCMLYAAQQNCFLFVKFALREHAGVKQALELLQLVDRT